MDPFFVSERLTESVLKLLLNLDNVSNVLLPFEVIHFVFNSFLRFLQIPAFDLYFFVFFRLCCSFENNSYRRIECVLEIYLISLDMLIMNSVVCFAHLRE